MTSAIDELLEDLRTREAADRDKVSAMITPWDVKCGTEKADRFARHIAAVEGLVAFKANHTGGLVSIEEIQAGDGVEVVLDPETKSWRSD